MFKCIFCGGDTTNTIEHRVLIDIEDQFGNGARLSKLTNIPACGWCYEFRQMLPWILVALGFIVTSALIFEVTSFLVAVAPAFISLLLAYAVQRQTAGILRDYQRNQYEHHMRYMPR